MVLVIVLFSWLEKSTWIEWVCERVLPKRGRLSMVVTFIGAFCGSPFLFLYWSCVYFYAYIYRDDIALFFVYSCRHFTSYVRFIFVNRLKRRIFHLLPNCCVYINTLFPIQWVHAVHTCSCMCIWWYTVLVTAVYAIGTAEGS